MFREFEISILRNNDDDDDDSKCIQDTFESDEYTHTYTYARKPTNETISIIIIIVTFMIIKDLV